MDLVYVLKLETPTIELDKNIDPIPVFKDTISKVKMFCHLFGFVMNQPDPFSRGENEAAHYLCQTGIHFLLVRELTIKDVALISSAVISFTAYTPLIIVSEDLRVLKKEE